MWNLCSSFAVSWKNVCIIYRISNGSGRYAVSKSLQRLANSSNAVPIGYWTQETGVLCDEALSVGSHYFLHWIHRTIVDSTSPLLLSGDPLTAEGAPHGFQCCSEFSIPMAYSVCSFLPMSFHSKRQNSKRARILKSNAPSSATLFLSFFLSFHFSSNILF